MCERGAGLVCPVRHMGMEGQWLIRLAKCLLFAGQSRPAKRALAPQTSQVKPKVKMGSESCWRGFLFYPQYQVNTSSKCCHFYWQELSHYKT